jgi:hypothetical protein
VKGTQMGEQYWSEVGKGKRADVYLEVRKRRGHIFFEWNKCLWSLVYVLSFSELSFCLCFVLHTQQTHILEGCTQQRVKLVYISVLRGFLYIWFWDKIRAYGHTTFTYDFCTCIPNYPIRAKYIICIRYCVLIDFSFEYKYKTHIQKCCDSNDRADKITYIT